MGHLNCDGLTLPHLDGITQQWKKPRSNIIGLAEVGFIMFPHLKRLGWTLTAIPEKAKRNLGIALKCKENVTMETLNPPPWPTRNCG